jgi:hypothetical protein
MRSGCCLNEELHQVKVALNRVLASTRPVPNPPTFHINLTLHKLRKFAAMTGGSHNI